MLRARGVSRAFGGHVVLDGVSVALDGGDRVGVVGPNGVGKTTLLRLLAGLDQPDAGTVERAPATLQVGYLPQEPGSGRDETILGYLARRTGVAAASAELDRWTERLADDPEAVEGYTEALERFLAVGGDDLEARAAEVADRVGLGRSASTTAERFDQPVATLSGGEAARLALAAILLTRADVLLLDEPTNNLDFAGIDQLEAFVDAFGGAVLVVSHDRAFLDRCVHRILELHEQSHRATEFAGGWSDYVAARDLARSQQYEAHDKYVAERDRLRERQRRQVGWSDKGVRKAKTSGEPDKNLRRKQAERSEKQAGKVKATERKLAQLERVDKPWEGWELRLSLAPTARSGDVVARTRGGGGRARRARRLGSARSIVEVAAGPHRCWGPTAPASRRCWARCSAPSHWPPAVAGRSRRDGRRARPAPLGLRRRRAGGRRRAAGHRAGSERDPLVAGQVRPRRRPRRPHRRRAVTG
ncbi:MAG: ATP-binding cassette domain-containing protein [Acidimicrobiales bacterium]